MKSLWNSVGMMKVMYAPTLVTATRLTKHISTYNSSAMPWPGCQPNCSGRCGECAAAYSVLGRLDFRGFDCGHDWQLFMLCNHS